MLHDTNPITKGRGMKSIKNILFILLILVLFFAPNYSFGAVLTNLADDLSRLKTGEYSNHTIKFKTPSGAEDVGDTITITFPASFDLSAVSFSDIDLSHGLTGTETEETLTNTVNATDWEATIVGNVLTLTHPTDPNNGDINLNDIAIIEIGTNANGGINRIKNGSAGNYTLSVAGTFGDNGQIPIVILTEDQFLADANVVPTISLSLSSNVTSFGPNNVPLEVVLQSSPDIILTVTTNHSRGYELSVYDQGNGTNPGLSSGPNIIGSANSSFGDTADLNAAQTGFGIQMLCLSGCQTDLNITAKYRLGANNVAGLKRTSEIFATYPSLMAIPHQIKVIHKAKVGTNIPGGTYSDKLTYLATAKY